MTQQKHGMPTNPDMSVIDIAAWLRTRTPLKQHQIFKPISKEDASCA